MSNNFDGLMGVLNGIDSGEFNISSDKKLPSPYILLHWMAFSKNPNKIKKLNLTANKWIFSLSESQAYNLLAACGGPNEKYTWIKRDNKTTKRPNTVKIIMEHQGVGEKEALEYSEVITLASAIDLCEDLGYHEKIKDIRKEFN